jgi:hypothetical protein
MSPYGKYGNTVNGKCTILSVIDIEAYGGVKLRLHAFLSLELSPCRFTPRRRVSGFHCIGFGRIIDTSENRKDFCPFLKLNHYSIT